MGTPLSTPSHRPPHEVVTPPPLHEPPRPASHPRSGVALADRTGSRSGDSFTIQARVLESMAEGVVLTDDAGLILYTNPAHDRMFGYAPGELVGRRVAALTDGPGESAAGGPSGAGWEGELRGRRKDGTAFDTYARVTGLEMAGGRYRVWVQEDVTERKRAERAVREREELLRTIIAHIPCAVFWKDRDSVYLGANDLIARTHGLDSPDLLVGSTDRDLPISPADAEFYRECDRRVMETGTPLLNLEETQTRPGGTAVLLTSKVPLRDHAGAVVGVLGVYQDITARKRAEDGLRASEERLRAVIETSPECVKVVAPDGTVLDMNRAGLAMAEAAGLDSVRGRPVFDLIATEDRAAFRELHRRVCAGEPGQLEYSIVGFHGTRRRVETTAVPLPGPGGETTHLGITRDVTEQRKLEEQYRQSQKMEAVGRLAGGIAHDFNNLLTVINGCAELLLEAVGDDPKARPLVADIEQAGRRAADLTRQLLAFGRKQILCARVLDLNDLLKDLGTMLARLLGEDIDLHVAAAPGPLQIKADPGQVQQVVLNLAVNGRDAMPDGGKLTIETRVVELDEEYARGRMEVRPGRYALLAVTDTGCGMDRATLARIWEPFFTTKGPERGTGLGLATVYGIVKQSGGHVEAYSEPDVGTTIKVYLPCAEGPVRARPARRRGAAPDGWETVLLVEDEAAVRSLTARVLRGRGYEVLEAATGDEALAAAAAHRGPVHLLVTDVVMPGMSGREVARRLAEPRPEARVLYVSGYTDDAVVRHGILEKETAFLQKPYTLDGLARKVREVLDKDGAPRPG